MRARARRVLKFVKSVEIESSEVTMWKAFITSCLVLSIASTDIAPRKCCPEGSVLLRRKDSCFDPKLNKTSSINKTLDCPIKVRLQHYTINSLGEIVLMVINGNNITIANDK